ncbi:hypothetical protein DCC39_02985 [Pueribacillus theae]|uniref:Uncharacterized protein n=1 Tax=Pueribacillus theae TaxID=2171751 RepID=A0A2U1K835_9BACI|nr:hypothetical protein [Pueribacillus theae]PWA13108.1 hypothetical protein DCC39_02985 [Pueribacillus theae]
MDEKPYYMIWMLAIFVVITLIAILFGLAQLSAANDSLPPIAQAETIDAFKSSVVEAAKY